MLLCYSWLARHHRTWWLSRPWYLKVGIIYGTWAGVVSLPFIAVPTALMVVEDSPMSKGTVMALGLAAWCLVILPSAWIAMLVHMGGARFGLRHPLLVGGVSVALSGACWPVVAGAWIWLTRDPDAWDMALMVEGLPTLGVFVGICLSPVAWFPAKDVAHMDDALPVSR